jgi:Na+-transporting NADH:ubiquinone oxidoreductase subunit NqrD
MGTASLVFGLILIGFGLVFGLSMFVEMIQGGNAEDDGTYGPLIIVAALFAVGGLLIRSFDKDRKKENKS